MAGDLCLPTGLLKDGERWPCRDFTSAAAASPLFWKLHAAVHCQGGVSAKDARAAEACKDVSRGEGRGLRSPALEEIVDCGIVAAYCGDRHGAACAVAPAEPSLLHDNEAMNVAAFHAVRSLPCADRLLRG